MLSFLFRWSKWIGTGLLLGLLIATMLLGFGILPERFQAQASNHDLNIESNVTTLLSQGSSIDDVLERMQQSSAIWQTVEVDYEAVGLDPFHQNVSSRYTHHFWLNNAENARVEIGESGSLASFIWVKNRAEMWTEDLEKQIYYREIVPQMAQNNSSADNLQYSEGEVTANPERLLLPSWLNDYIYPQGLAQAMRITSPDTNQTLEILGEDVVAGRKTIILERKITSLNEPNELYKWHKYWIDIEFGTVLKAEIYVPLNGSLGQVITCTAIKYNTVIAPSIFEFQPASASHQINPENVFNTENLSE